MSHQASNIGPEENTSIVQKIGGAIGDFLNCLGVRLIVTFLVGTLIMAAATDMIYPQVLAGFANELTIKLAAQAEKGVPGGQQILQLINKHNLAWYYVTGSDNKVSAATKPYAPNLPKYEIVSHHVEWNKQRYYEAVSSISNGQVLHVGFYGGPTMLPNLSQGPLLFNLGITTGYAGILLVGLLLLTIILLQLWISKPLAHLARACYSLLLARDAYSHVTGGGLDVSGAATEVKNISKGLKDIRRQYDEAIAAKAAKEQEIKRERSAHQEEKQMISQQYNDQLAQTQHKLTELKTKEAEEEFISSLVKEIGSLKASNQVCQRVLEKLNDKFPNSIIYGAGFKLAKDMDCSMEASLGFDDKSVRLLKAVDHTSIVRQTVMSGQQLIIADQAIRDYGLNLLAQNNSIKTIVYFPVRHQGRNLAMLSFYFMQEGQTVLEIMRVLRNVAEHTGRTLHAVVQYEEEQEAARTDPMTGLRNKKFFYEIIPQVFQQAAAKPEENPVSIIMIDGDHFKSINDTYGHQVGDQMLQELAKTIKLCVRTQDSIRSATPGDFLIRFGGEEFVVVMEKTEAQRALSVAERIRQAVEQKNDWPGGVIRWTISLGVATFPFDGKNAEDVISKADVALYYVKEELGRNKVCHVQQVPKTYKAKKKAAAIEGELGVFDAAGLLQSIAQSQKTGVLTVSAKDGSQFWMLFEVGKPVQARMGKLAGNASVTEFLVTFEVEEGKFNFREVVQSESNMRLARLDDSYNVTRGLDRCLMDGALATDNYNASLAIVPTTELLVMPIGRDEFVTKWNGLAQLEDPPSPEEFEVMGEIVKRADGNHSLTQIFKDLQPKQSHLLYRAAALLVQHGLLQTRPIAAKV